MIKTIVFDLDGVLCDTPDLHFNTFQAAVCKYLDVRITKGEHDVNFNGLSTNKKLETLQAKYNFSDETKKQIWEEKQRLTTLEIQACLNKDDEKINLLELLSEKYTLVCASNCIRQTMDLMLERLGIQKYFKYTLCNEDVKNIKPHPEIYLRAMIQVECGPKETLIIEDSKFGFEAAKQSGAHILRVSNSHEVNERSINEKLSTLVNERVGYKYKNKNLNIVVPMAGQGSRFAQAGYTFPKPLIHVDHNKTMIELATDCLDIDGKYIFIVLKEHDEQYNLSEYLGQIIPDSQVVLQPGKLNGAVLSVLMAEELINNDQPLIIMNSDQYIEYDVFDFMKKNEYDNLDASILTFNASHPKWSFAKINDEGLVTEVAEKRPISNIATVGVYWWRRGSDFVKFAHQMMDKNITVNNEFYVCPVFNEAIQDGLRVGIFNVDEMWGLGTPEDLEYYLQHKG